MDKYIGRLLDNRYEILEVIGTGGMAVVYKARCHRLNRLVAIKILKDDYLEDEEFRRRFHSESQAVAMLSHPNIVSVYDVSTSITADYIVMELIDGITLKQYMEKKGVLNWKETLHFAIQIGKALEHAHSRGIVHRDIKPHNVMVLKNGSVKVTDFGIARMMSKGNTLTKEALGSVHYISPEQAKGGRVDNRSDIYSLGVVMYEMMSGRPPYDGESPVAVAIQHINGGAVMPSTLNPNIPGGLEQIIMKAMAHEPGDRYPTATQMLADMDEFRKSPAILFDYNTPPIDEVTKLQKPPLVLEPEQPKTTAERVEQKKSEDATGERRRTPSGQRRTPGGQRSSSANRSGTAARKRREPEKDEETKSNAATIAIIASCAALVVGIVIILVLLLGGAGGRTQMVEVPSLLGKQYEELPEYTDFVVEISKEVYDNTYPAGQIIEQNPAAGEQVPKNDKVYVTVSLGEAPKVVTMPDVAKWELKEAERALNNLGMNLKLVIKEEYDDEIPKDSVIRTDPIVDTELTAGQEVTLYVSLGMEFKTAVMPDVTGDKKDNAIKVLETQELDLDITVEEIFDSEVPEGDVVRTDPSVGQELSTGQQVVLYISKGPEMKIMPNVTGMAIDKAVNILLAEGLTKYKIEQVDSEEDKDTVVSQSVEKDTEVDINTQIILQVSKGPEPSQSTGSVQKTITLNLPDGLEEAYLLQVFSNGAVVYETTVQPDLLRLNVTLSGNGTQYFDIYINGEYSWPERVDFAS